MSLFGTSPPAESPPPSSRTRTLFSEDDQRQKSSQSLFDDDDNNGASSSPWDTPTASRRRSRADLVRSLLRPSDVPASYIEAFDRILEDDDEGVSLGKIGGRGLDRVFAAGRISAERKGEILRIVGAGDDGAEVGRNEFNVLLALVGLAQEGERVSLDAVDERRGGEFLSLFFSISVCSVSCPILSLIVWTIGALRAAGCDLRVLHSLSGGPAKARYHWPLSHTPAPTPLCCYLGKPRIDWPPISPI